ncbi:MAG TPA: TIM-barrel domain-containing protein [Thermoanaerobaculia bacterium]|nr:TIM-barrel domain-containing protein [Thermoanaerobaculia bacterium]
MRKILLLLLLAASVHAEERWNPVADPKAIVIEGQARFTVLTPRLIRMEWGQFEDHASLVFVNRRLPVPQFTTSHEDGWLVVRTQRLTLRYKPGAEFSADNLSVQFDFGTWKPGMPDKGNLGGTIRTLDGARGAVPLAPGLLSRDGWVVVDDSDRPLFDNSDWPWVMDRPAGKRQDIYLFAYGHDYKQELSDYTLVAGKIALPPRFAFGTWWSRYWAYTDTEFMELVRGFQQHDIPLDVLVIDMDWHPTFGVKWWENKKDQSGHTLGWTGYTWNKIYFPDPPAFLKWVHDQGLKTTLNMHPASGVQPFEEQYPQMARAMGIDPATQKYVPFDITNKKFAENYFDILHHPLEQEGIDFFWLDWQQEQNTSVAGVNPTWWLNYTHFTDMERRGKRGMLFHRWGGLGNHRYQIGFSGDTIAVWESLAFQPYFTATAANVGYGYWSHDIGGHMRVNLGSKPAAGIPQDPDYPELYTRWIQWGAFSPILRTHTTKDPQSERRIWAYPAKYAAAMRDAYVLRESLIPYIYTAARNAYDNAVSIVHPLYYEYPESPEAYDYKDEYFFGNDMIVAPIAAPVRDDSRVATQKIWLPPGTWIEWFTGAQLQGPAKIERSFALDEIPVYVRAGAIIPMQRALSLGRGWREAPGEGPLIVDIFPRADGETRLYEDAGDSLGYKTNEFAWTTVRHGGNKIEILPAEGSYPGMPASRGYEIRLVNTLPPDSVAGGTWTYDGPTLTTIINVPLHPVNQRVEVTVNAPAAPPELVNGVRGELNRLRTAMEILDTSWPNGWSPDIVIEAAQTGRRMTLHPAAAREELEKLQSEEPAILDAISKMDVDCGFTALALNHLGHVTTCVPAPAK